MTEEKNPGWTEWKPKTADPGRAARKEAYLAGRWEINGRRLRFEAGLDICFAALRILEEYAADCESEFFVCIHEDDLEQVRDLITRWQAYEGGDPEMAWHTAWLKDVADLLPRLWD